MRLNKWKLHELPYTELVKSGTFRLASYNAAAATNQSCFIATHRLSQRKSTFRDITRNVAGKP